VIRALALALAILPACRPSDEAVLSSKTRAAMTAVNEGRPAGVLADVAADFRGPGGLDAVECRRLVRGLLSRSGWVRVLERELEVEVEGDAARVAVEVVAVAGREVKALEDLLPTEGELHRFELDWVRRNGAWAMTRAAHRRGGPRGAAR
jgi:hypothetical protein